jgi:tagatose 1,6-diphosphate aldolase GatY/KbaY
MLARTLDIVRGAQQKHIAIAAVNTYTLELTQAILVAAERERQPVILQLGVQSVTMGGAPLIVATLAAAREASVPVAVHLDHCSDLGLIEICFARGISSALADGSRLPLEENIAFTHEAVGIARRFDGVIEAELGYLSGTEDGKTVEEIEASLTDPAQAYTFIEQTGASLLAVSIGNVHGHTTHPPHLDFERLAQIAAQVDVPLVLHGASGIPGEDIWHTIQMGIAKININTEVRAAFLRAIAAWGMRYGPVPDLRRKDQDLLALYQEARSEAEKVVTSAIRLYSSGL